MLFGSGVTALGVLRCLGRSRIPVQVVGKPEPYVRGSRWYRAAPTYSHEPLTDYLGSLSLRSAVLIPCSDEWVARVGELPSHLRHRFPSSIPTPEVSERFIDKGQFARLLGESGVPHPRTFLIEEGLIPDEVGEFDRAFIKPRDSQEFQRRFGVKGWWPEDRVDLQEKLRVLEGMGIPALVQEYIPGPPSNHYFLDGFLDARSQVRTAFLRRRLRMFPPDFGNSTYMVSVELDEAGESVPAILGMLGSVGYRGVFSAEMKRDPRDGLLKVLEVNARPWWYVGFAAYCGIDVMGMAYRDALGLPLTDVPSYRVGRRLVHPYFDLHACLSKGTSRGRGALTWLGSMVGVDRPLFQWDDPLPGIIEAGRLTKEFLAYRVGKGSSREEEEEG